MSPRLPTIIQNDIDKKDSELKEIGQSLASFEWVRNRLEEQIATYGKASAPIHQLRHLQDTIEKITDLEITQNALEAVKSALESELERSLITYKDKYQLELGSTHYSVVTG
jgi:flagellar biosynthesis chaperone FliJ